ncbi:DUF871 domain-containing protein [Vagococcus acidifermentans]|uniref:Outer surface protein n=1 Tax=Vagococcus acidifermentans TaxID=564710 RepID=A0A430AUN6_9ENTE|nr:MupG family TIM beta-alpha barrel fold protein [Vagococcus acidifermentans]RSU11770.1 outer surface protein [Vagococcus acidifermentans]
MRKLGVSIYPNHSSLEEIKQYLSLAAKYGFTRVFTCLLSVGDDKETLLKEFKESILHARSLGMEVIADVSPRIFDEIGISYKDLTFFEEIGTNGIRLDMGYTGNEESIMTFNPQHLAIELNISNGTRYLENILSYKANRSKLLGCHNFYPHRYSGLSYTHFVNTTTVYKEHGIRTAAFVNSPTATIGPWPVEEGLCTLEIHRNWPITTQAKHLWATDLIDDVIIANAFASEEELRALGELDPYKLTFDVVVHPETPETERRIMFDEFHFNRGDVSDYLVRSTQSRVKYKGHEFVPFHTADMETGDVIIDTSLYAHYAGELQIAKRPMENSGKSNVVGTITASDKILLDYLEPWQKFALKEVHG